MTDRVMAVIKKSGRGRKLKYSYEQRAGTITTNQGGNASQVIVDYDENNGVRKVKHITVSMAYGGSVSDPTAIWWAVVYNPAGVTNDQLYVDNGRMYEPNQYVMGCGCFDFNSGPLRVHIPVSRNLNSGDKICLLLRANSPNVGYIYCCSYAIAYN